MTRTFYPKGRVTLWASLYWKACSTARIW